MSSVSVHYPHSHSGTYHPCRNPAELNNLCNNARNKNKLSFGILRNIYFAKIQSLVRYGIILWSGEKESSKVLIMQKKGIPYNERYK